MPENLFIVTVIIMSQLFSEWLQKSIDSVPRSRGIAYIDYDQVKIDDRGRKFIEYILPPISIDMIAKYIETYLEEKEKWEMKNVPPS